MSPTTPSVWDAMALAAQLWCREDTEMLTMDVNLANSFAQRIKQFECELAAELKERSWITH
jgi:hypothetical protein